MATRSRELPGGKIVTWEVVPGGRPPFPGDLSPEGMALRSMTNPDAALASVVEEKANPPTGPLRPGAPGYGRCVAPERQS